MMRPIIISLLLVMLCAPLRLAIDSASRLTTAPAKSATLLFAGDLMQHSPQISAALRGDGQYDYSAVFEHVAPLFHAVDYSVINLETTLDTVGPYRGYPMFRSPAQIAEAIKSAGIDAAVLANNHCMDRGRRGAILTQQLLNEQGISHTGVSLDAKRPQKPISFSRGGLSFDIFSYTYGTNGMPVPMGMAVNMIDTLCMSRDLERSTAEIKIVFIHWGNEYELQENSVQRSLAAHLRESGADIIIGSHPHVIQPYYSDSEGVVFYSLGNFVSNQRKRHCDGGLLAQVKVVVQPNGDKSFEVEGIPIWVDTPTYRVLPQSVADTIDLSPQARLRYAQFILDTGCYTK